MGCLKFVFVRETVLEHLVEALLRDRVFLEVEEAWSADFCGAAGVDVGRDGEPVLAAPNRLAAAVA